jgi:hypothetical protein
MPVFGFAASSKTGTFLLPPAFTKSGGNFVQKNLSKRLAFPTNSATIKVFLPVQTFYQ